MSCCGKMRQQFAQATSPAPAEPKVRPSGAQFTISFEYVGRTGLTVFGPASGRRYRFDAPGARLAVDPRDRPGLAQIALLREVR